MHLRPLLTGNSLRGLFAPAGELSDFSQMSAIWGFGFDTSS
jgi:hypothetical protein